MSDKPKISIDVEPLLKRKLYIATPAYGGNMHMSFVRSLLDLQHMLSGLGIYHEIKFMGNESLIPRARNTLADLFMSSTCTDMMFIDSDIEFNAQDVVIMLHMNKDMIGGAYPLKTILWDNVKRALAKDPNIPGEQLPLVASKWSAHMEQEKIAISAFEPIPVFELATGFLMFKREVLEKLQDTVPSFTNPPDDPVNPDGVGHDYFPIGIHNGRFESEDYAFCRLWRELGGELWLCPWINLTHWGTQPFPGNMMAQAALLGEIH